MNTFKDIILEALNTNGIEVIDQSHLNCDTIYTEDNSFKKLAGAAALGATLLGGGLGYMSNKLDQNNPIEIRQSQLSTKPIIHNTEVDHAVAYPLKHRVEYYLKDGSAYKLGKGSLNLRCNNPGNLVANNLESAKKLGGIALNHMNGNNFIVFPTYEAGYNALWNWWVKCDKSQTIKDAMHKFAPKFENDLESYLDHLNSNISVNRQVHSLSKLELKILLDAIIHFEGHENPLKTELN